ncbi:MULTISPECIES: hypothetical protein [Deinococcus]|jgi:hypothetical protein|uniref:Lipoprotein n=1 Tax=Deinococcus radiodurans (strain ATCC 13939 / DSM 20539 / JCM 16871 / CCUG 27074 / LMG 4051 / NBRC 15346 / NCIMB 9279 / VKM B-1422 / R1) TaxID=243230 RepID=Q9RUB6_DEIRA|nr:hypothetical protein [Deinococcus radiodurans]AAF11048.1 hypothetical protein DR_1474 [Deinococcus radiodurans R1 = ATCC 13939 = DSM 20539]ANC71393.1 hypothetical protein A2G07_06200 [Deinococcus radiodurans R1 = ATCC 13939 = DSM 20539]QEM70921.1 hypothetical protein DXG80_03535 [Deinococcus radiodurans]QIP29487.1 hypothetical protein HAV23_10255 [Deinococcus radiodurans]QIP31826.1 hypothetical protein HAV35_06540 [Deinococcus radiodurans]
MTFLRSLGAALAAVGLLASCAPRTGPAAAPVRASTPVASVSFYPREAGLVWTYLPESEDTSAVPYVLRGLGPTIFSGVTVTASQLSGRGADQTWYRLYDSRGVRLLGFHKPGVTVSLNPAWQEYPSETAWKVGLVWQGQSAITVASDEGKVQAQGTLNYRYEVQDRRQVKTQAGTFDVWVVTRQISDDVGGLFPATEQLWFTPYVGEVRTPEGLLLTSRNFAPKGGSR